MADWKRIDEMLQTPEQRATEKQQTEHDETIQRVADQFASWVKDLYVLLRKLAKFSASISVKGANPTLSAAGHELEIASEGTSIRVRLDSSEERIVCIRGQFAREGRAVAIDDGYFSKKMEAFVRVLTS